LYRFLPEEQRLPLNHPERLPDIIVSEQEANDLWEKFATPKVFNIASPIVCHEQYEFILLRQ
tara:strand:+ start:79 stop:264 length:186 start_codon:yes stop_codon:yes gene_type:complete